MPELPVIIHSFSPEEGGPFMSVPMAAFLEKSENTDRLKTMVRDVLAKAYPDRMEGSRP
jgi:hypothetical protein